MCVCGGVAHRYSSITYYTGRYIIRAGRRIDGIKIIFLPKKTALLPRRSISA